MPSGASRPPITIQSAGSDLAARARLNFTGAGVSVQDNPSSGRVDVTISGGGSNTPGTFNVRNYGAVGDFTANDSPAFQLAHNAAIAYGPNRGVVYIPTGYYRLDSPINWNPNGVTSGMPIGVSWMGDGMYNSILKYTGTTGTFLNITRSGGNSFQDFRIIGSNTQGSTGGATCFSIAGSADGGAAFMAFNRIAIHLFQTALQGDSFLVNYFHQCLFEAVERGINLNAASFTGNNANIIRDTRIVPAWGGGLNTNGMAINVDYGSGNVVSGCNIEYYGGRSTDYGIRFGGYADFPTPNAVRDCWFESFSVGGWSILLTTSPGGNAGPPTVIETCTFVAGGISINTGRLGTFIHRCGSANVTNATGSQLVRMNGNYNSGVVSNSGSNLTQVDGYT